MNTCSENSAVLQTIRTCLPKVDGWENSGILCAGNYQCRTNARKTQNNSIHSWGENLYRTQTIRDCLPKGDGYKLEVKIPNGILEPLKFAGQGRVETYSNSESGVKKIKTLQRCP